MSENTEFKLGITIGPMKGQREFATDVEHPPFAVNQANRYIYDNYDKDTKLVLVSGNNRRKTRRR